MKDLHRQAGMTAIGWLFVLALVMFFSLVAIRLMPVYMESFKVGSALESLKQEPYVTQKSRNEIMSLILRRFEVDDVDSVDPKTDITITNDNGHLKIDIAYERRVHLLGNIDIAARFDKHTEIVAN